MKSLFIVRVEALTITEELGRGDQFGNLFRITNDANVIAEFLPQCFAPIVGDLETSYLLSGLPVVYATEEFSPSDDSDAIRHLTLRIMQVCQFLHLLWYERDNAAHTEMGYLVTALDEPRPKVHRNSFGGLRTDASGQLRPVRFSREELRNARQHFDSLEPPESVEASQILVESLGRWGRADYFVQAARASGDLGVKLANYCTALEALFSRDNQELSHKLAERVALFVETDSDKRRDLYQQMKRAYAIRSKVVHGVSGSTKLFDQSREAVTTCDNVCRRSLLKIREEVHLHGIFFGEESDKGLDELFLSLMFGE